MKAPVSKLAKAILADNKQKKLLLDFLSSSGGMEKKEAPILEVPIDGKIVKVQPRLSSFSE